MLTASLSAVHLLGFTLVMGSALVSNLRMLNVLFAGVPTSDITGPASRALLAGLCLSAVTGALLFMPRASGAAANGTFRLKLTMAALACVLQFLVQQRVSRNSVVPDVPSWLSGGLCLALWLGTAVAACAYILLE